MAGEDARLKAGLKSAEDELNLIKNQIQQTLLDIREHILDVTNPFNSIMPEQDAGEETVIEDSGGDGGAAGDVINGEGGEGGEGVESEEVEGDKGEESFEEQLEPGSEVLASEGVMEGDEYEDGPMEEMYQDGGGVSTGRGQGGLMDLLEPAPEDEVDPDEGFELDEEATEDPADESIPLFGAEIEEEEQTEPVLPQDNVADEFEQPASTGDGVADAVAAALAANVDLLTMASLVRWTAVTRDRIGANRLDILLDAYELAGRISPQMKNVVRTLSMLGDEDADGIPVRDVVTAMVRMEGVLNTDESRESNRLLGLLLEMDDDPLDRLAA